jgi:hypothetical protein
MSGNMFEDRVKEKEAAEAELKAQCVREAGRVSDHFVRYIGEHPNIYGPTILVGVEDNRVTLRKKASDDRMEITVTAILPPKYRLSGAGASKVEVDNRGMTGKVIDWMKRP